MTTLPCIVCCKQLDPAFPQKEQDLLKETHNTTGNQPNNGTCFQSSGNYGSTVFDPVSTHIFAEINICDECWKMKKASGAIQIFRTTNETKYFEATDDDY